MTPHMMASDRLITIIDQIHPAFAGVLKRLNTREWDITSDRCFDIDDKGEMSYLPKGKECTMEGDNWAQLHRQTGKTGRMLKKFPIEWDNDQEVEQLSHDIASYFVEPEIMIFSGKDIVKYYDESKYTKKAGTLGDSCMRHSRCAPFLEIYSENPDKVSLAVMMQGTKISTRALIWKLDDGRTFMDRVYYIDEKSKNVMIRWAQLQKFSYKANQNNDPSGNIITDGKSLKDSIRVTLSKSDFSQYPYMDTFRYLNVDANLLSNTKGIRSLQSTGGGYENA